jgi:repressor LexA
MTISVPLVGSAPCGAPLLAEKNIETWYPVSTQLVRPGAKYFLLKATGDSMYEVGIADGPLVLVRQQETALSGTVVVALVDDEVTIKELRLSNDAAALVPRSSNKSFKPILAPRIAGAGCCGHLYPGSRRTIASLPRRVAHGGLKTRQRS